MTCRDLLALSFRRPSPSSRRVLILFIPIPNSDLQNLFSSARGGACAISSGAISSVHPHAGSFSPQFGGTAGLCLFF